MAKCNASKERKAAERPHPGAAEPGRLTDCLASTGNREATELVAHTVSGAAEPRLKRAVASFKRPASVPETHAASSNSRHDQTEDGAGHSGPSPKEQRGASRD